MTTHDIEIWAKCIESQLAPYQNEECYEFESCFNDLIATVKWTCDVVAVEGDYYTSPSWYSKNERLDISVIDEDGIQRTDISDQLVRFIS